MKQRISTTKPKQRNNLSGWIVLYKPVGMSSAHAVGKVRRALNIKKIGHAGTLDPLAEGVLPLALGEATKTISYAMDADKEYVFTICFGSATDTEDREGEVIETSSHHPTKSEIVAILPQFTGIIEQMPPRYSALKINGKRACDLMREGKEVELKTRSIIIHELELLTMEDSEHATLRCCCSKGTYIRSLARDIAKALGSCGHVSMLKRSRVGSFAEKDTISLEKLEEIGHNAPPFDFIKPIDAALDDILVLQIEANDARAIQQGQRITAPSAALAEGTFALYCEDRLIAFAEHQQGSIRAKRVFNT